MISKPSEELCSKCVNWLEHTPGIIECDFDYFVPTPVAKAELFLSILFDCEDYEELKEDK